ncbi:hypothetical protein SCATT_04050 [Streptantibioticus cattleyicolor NRRL 8057 = DSM 46488]|uniref:Uncharacterized protein n=1 Tax=Streptantibioticus cattleyicolor (strain ATCC 35852 / DSM 46488 / JCM 4925 / NBRC 14057 / NRRL 8057) TaxID=1003195 RepID=G8WNL4_STREN|nr:hypothetical protein SCATT_04050 [Streptantibioticus cattleyicolor NRRL 8057 = DSM 46488]
MTRPVDAVVGRGARRAGAVRRKAAGRPPSRPRAVGPAMP